MTMAAAATPARTFRPETPSWVTDRSESAGEMALLQRRLALLSAISAATGITDRHALYSTKEFKKVRVRYFTDDEARWETEHT